MAKAKKSEGKTSEVLIAVVLGCLFGVAIGYVVGSRTFADSGCLQMHVSSIEIPMQNKGGVSR